MNSSRIYLRNHVESIGKRTSSESLVLDAGAGDLPYKSFFDHCNYESADFCQVDKEYGVVDYVCDLREIPVDDDKYDVVLLTQVLEHLPEPKEVLVELNRILKPGGTIYVTCPLYYEEHEKPYDFYRYTQFGLNHLLAAANFEVVDVTWLEGYYGTLAYQFSLADRSLAPGASELRGFKGALCNIANSMMRPFFRLLSWYFTRLDLHHKHTATGHPKNYCVVATKKHDA